MARIAAAARGRGWVDIIQHVGAAVRTFDAHAFERTIRLLARLEGLATALSAPHLTADDLAEARSLNTQMSAALSNLDTNLFGSLNRRFHELLCSRCDDEHLNDLVANEWARLDFIRRSAYWYAPPAARKSRSSNTPSSSISSSRAPTPETIEPLPRSTRRRRSSP